MRTLTGHVSVRDADGQTHSFGPGDEIPDWAAEQVTNPRLWEDGEVPFPAKGIPGVGGSPPAAAPAGSTQELEDRIVARVLDGVGELLRDLVEVADDGAGPDGEDSGVSAGPPPKAGKGSGEDKWRAYATEQGVDVTGIEDRNEIIAFLKDAGVRVE